LLDLAAVAVVGDEAFLLRANSVLLRSEAMTKRIRAFLSDESGATAIEYAIIASLIAIAIVPALTNLGKKLSSEFAEVSSNLK
jgi:pilus assembly protein Flp/PilA